MGMRLCRATFSSRRMDGLRWAFGCGSWQPSRCEWLLAARCVQAEERERIGAFVFARDAKAAMGGRLLIRKLIAEKLKIPWNEIQLQRTTKGKPFLANPVLTTIPNFNFNISHQGDYTVLAAEPNRQVGVDIMKTNFPGTSSVTEFFRIMNRQFTDHEWKTINMAGDEWAQLDMFYRHWMRVGQVSKETIMFLDGDQEEAWAFEETMLDDNHHVAVALSKPDIVGKYPVQLQENINQEQSQFTILAFKDLISSAIAMAPEDPMYWENFQAKQEKTSRQHRVPV
ncbi:L-aminoadipate-semialdehyde dehydrogenase-phosphopantetheinyl transferase isoform X2 [Carcharodon carcharias]|uniref:L-aminoadipate-semialdehyde dehydrogenase-phosphopantetheinyl transferase isoform X2 n=1 Tax=Carcharodon carcharias TaxID=13397 RepID=UPI001B7E7FC2|nr:L-aminoadipate-semialdehyde dehydrogenase-phosphopantetheinyl transferase isoform X2 [Carcharodon carcharias]